MHFASDHSLLPPSAVISWYYRAFQWLVCTRGSQDRWPREGARRESCWYRLWKSLIFIDQTLFVQLQILYVWPALTSCFDPHQISLETERLGPRRVESLRKEDEEWQKKASAAVFSIQDLTVKFFETTTRGQKGKCTKFCWCSTFELLHCMFTPLQSAVSTPRRNDFKPVSPLSHIPLSSLSNTSSRSILILKTSQLWTCQLITVQA